MLGVVKLEPVPSDAPPLAAAYQFRVPPAQPVAVRLTVPGPQRKFAPPAGASGIGLTVAVTAVLGETQSPIVHDT